MHRFYIPPEAWRLDHLSLDPGQAHHCLDVVRLKPGERVVVFNGRGAEATAEITAAGKQEVGLKHLHHSASARLPCEITLGQAVPKGRQMDLIVQKATELGAAAIAPLLSERTVVQFDAGEARAKREKWTAIAIEAAKQCGQNWLPEIHAPCRLKQFFDGDGRPFLAFGAGFSRVELDDGSFRKEGGDRRRAKLGGFLDDEVHLPALRDGLAERDLARQTRGSRMVQVFEADFLFAGGGYLGGRLGAAPVEDDDAFAGLQ